MTKQVGNNAFDSTYNWLLLVPLLVILLGVIIAHTRDSSILGYGEQLLSGLPLFIVYRAQFKYFRLFYPGKKLARQLYLSLIALFVPPLTLLAGDMIGSSNFNTPSNGLKEDLLGGFIAGGILAAIFVYMFLVGNVIFIKTGGKNNALRIFGKVVYVFGWLIVTALAWVIYSVTYSLHDPSTE